MDDVKITAGNAQERWRWATARTKEPGTVRWIETYCQPGDTFYDIGANVGVYTLMAAQQVGVAGRVYAFEPHVANAKSLLQTLGLNEVGAQVQVLTCALHDTMGFFPFHYSRMEAGTSGHQLGHTEDERGKQFVPMMTELKYATTIDELLDRQVIQPATLVKLDVDGNEIKILRGMHSLLMERPPRSVQVEVHPKDEDQVLAYMEHCQYGLAERHYTQFGQEAIAAGADPARIAHNVIFKVR